MGHSRNILEDGKEERNESEHGEAERETEQSRPANRELGCAGKARLCVALARAEKAGRASQGSTQENPIQMKLSGRDLLTFHLCFQLGVYLSNLLITLFRLENRKKTLRGDQGVP